jgi:hypothetical protein
VSRGLNGSRQSSRSGTDTYHFISAHGLLRPHLRAFASLGFNNHSGLQRFYASSDIRSAVYDHDAVGAATDGAKHAAWFVPAGCVAVNHNAVATKRYGDGFTLKAIHGLSIEGKLDFASFFKASQNWVFFYAHGYISRIL